MKCTNHKHSENIFFFLSSYISSLSLTHTCTDIHMAQTDLDLHSHRLTWSSLSLSQGVSSDIFSLNTFHVRSNTACRKHTATTNKLVIQSSINNKPCFFSNSVLRFSRQHNSPPGRSDACWCPDGECCCSDSRQGWRACHPHPADVAPGSDHRSSRILW